jgi:hypothetical protein
VAPRQFAGRWSGPGHRLCRRYRRQRHGNCKRPKVRSAQNPIKILFLPVPTMSLCWIGARVLRRSARGAGGFSFFVAFSADRKGSKLDAGDIALLGIFVRGSAHQRLRGQIRLVAGEPGRGRCGVRKTPVFLSCGATLGHALESSASLMRATTAHSGL